MMVPLPPGWLCLQDCNLSGQLNRPLVMPFVLMHPDVGVVLIDVAPASNPDAEAVLRRRLEAAHFESIFPGFLPILHLRLDRADLPSTEAILRDAFASRPPLSVPAGDGWVSVVRRALLPRDPSRAAAHPGGLLATQFQRSPRSIGPILRTAETEADMLRREVAAHADADTTAFEPPVPEQATRTTPPIIWIIMSSVGGLIAVLALFTLLNNRADAPNAGGDTASAPTASVSPPAAPAPTIATAPPAVTPAAPTLVPSPDSLASSPRAPPVAPPPAATAAALPARPPQPPPAPNASPAASATAGAGAPVAPAPAQRPAATTADRLPRVTVREPSNLRTGPDGQSNVVRVVPRGESLRVHSRAPNGWVQVGDAEPSGWIHNSRLSAVE